MEDDSPSYINTLSDADHQRFFTGCNFFQRIILEKATNSNFYWEFIKMSNSEALQNNLKFVAIFKVEIYGFAAACLSSRWRKFIIIQWWRKLWKSDKNVEIILFAGTATVNKWNISRFVSMSSKPSSESHSSQTDNTNESCMKSLNDDDFWCQNCLRGMGFFNWKFFGIQIVPEEWLLWIWTH